jgi:hypothetical protein
MLTLLTKPDSSKKTRKRERKMLGQLMGYFCNIKKPTAGMSRAQHKNTVRLEWLFNGPYFSSFLGWAKHKQKMKNSTINQFLYLMRHMIE